jgi:hypothetical protein
MEIKMAQDYEILDFKKGTFQDNYGNYWCDMALKGFGEPVRIAVKDPTEFHEGMSLYGVVEEKESKAGKSYYRFKREKKEETSASSSPSNNWESPERQDSINRSVALNNANILFQSTAADADEVLRIADKYYDWLKNHQTTDVIEPVTDKPITLDDIPF